MRRMTPAQIAALQARIDPQLEEMAARPPARSPEEDAALTQKLLAQPVDPEVAWFSDYLDGELPDSQARAVLARLATDDTLRYKWRGVFTLEATPVSLTAPSLRTEDRPQRMKNRSRAEAALEICDLMDLLDGPRAALYREICSRDLAKDVEDARRWIGAVQIVRDAGVISREVSWYLMDHAFVAVCHQAMDEDPEWVRLRAESDAELAALAELRDAVDTASDLPVADIPGPQTLLEESGDMAWDRMLERGGQIQDRVLREYGEHGWADARLAHFVVDDVRTGERELYGRTDLDLLTEAFRLGHRKPIPEALVQGIYTRYLESVDAGAPLPWSSVVRQAIDAPTGLH